MPNPDKKQTLIILKQLERFHVDLDLKALKDRLTPLKKELESGRFTIVVAGEVKKGKSSLINAILEIGNLLPVYSDVVTSTSFKIVYGAKRKNTVFFKKQMPEFENEGDLERLFDESKIKEPPPLVIEDDKLAAYGTEAGNKGNIKEVSYIQIELPNKILQSGLEIIDTPGLGGLFQYHAEITWKHIPTADAVLFILDSADSPITKEEETWIRKIKNFSPVIVFTQTKTDLVSAEQWKSWQDRNLDGLSAVLEKPKEEIRYFPISSRFRASTNSPDSKVYERSGFKVLEDFFFNQLHQEIIGAKCRTIVDLMHHGLSKKLQDLNKQLKVKEETSKEKLENLHKQYTDANVNIKELELKIYPDLKEDFFFELGKISHNGIQSISNFLTPNKLNPEIRNFIKTFNLEKEKPGYINKNIDKLVGYFTDDLSQKSIGFYQDYMGQIQSLVENYTNLLGSHLEKINVSDPDGDDELIALSMSDDHSESSKLAVGKAEKIRFDYWDMTRNLFTSTTIGTSLGYAAGSLIAVFFPPVGVYLAVAALTGSGFGLLASGLSTVAKRKKQVLNHLQSLMLGVMNQLQKKLVSQFRLDISNIKNQVNKEFRKVIREAKDFNNNQLLAIKQQMSQEGKVNKKEVKLLQGQINTVKNMLTYLNKIN